MEASMKDEQVPISDLRSHIRTCLNTSPAHEPNPDDLPWQMHGIKQCTDVACSKWELCRDHFGLQMLSNHVKNWPIHLQDQDRFLVKVICCKLSLFCKGCMYCEAICAGQSWQASAGYDQAFRKVRCQAGWSWDCTEAASRVLLRSKGEASQASGQLCRGEDLRITEIWYLIKYSLQLAEHSRAQGAPDKSKDDSGHWDPLNAHTI